jgi:TRAP transporter TAXI family solute receptor
MEGEKARATPVADSAASKGMINVLSTCLALCFGFFLIDGGSISTVKARDISVVIGTGNKTGVYYPVGKAIATIVNPKSRTHDIRVRVESTAGSVFNMNAVTLGDLEFGIVQSDDQYQAWNGLKAWKERGPQKNLRAVCSFHAESVVLVAGNDTKVETLNDLKHKVVNIGNPGSGVRGNAIDALQACGIDWRRELNAEGIRTAQSASLLENYRLDAFFYTIGHPSDIIKQATEGKRTVRFVPLTGDCIDRLIAKWPYYTKAFIPVKYYPLARNRENVETFGVKSTFCTSTIIPDHVVYIITREIFNHLDAFKKLHPACDVLTKEKMLEALSAPIHPGALKYYNEAGLAVASPTPR